MPKGTVDRAVPLVVVREEKKVVKPQKLFDRLGYKFVLSKEGQLEVNGEVMTEFLAAKIRTQIRELGLGDYIAELEDYYKAQAYDNRRGK